MKNYFNREGRIPEIKFLKHRYGVMQRTEVTETEFLEACGSDAEVVRKFLKTLKEKVYKVECVSLCRGTSMPARNIVLVSTYHEALCFNLGGFESVMYAGDYYTIKIKLEGFEIEILEICSIKEI